MFHRPVFRFFFGLIFLLFQVVDFIHHLGDAILHGGRFRVIAGLILLFLNIVDFVQEFRELIVETLPGLTHGVIFISLFLLLNQFRVSLLALTHLLHLFRELLDALLQRRRLRLLPLLGFFRRLFPRSLALGVRLVELFSQLVDASLERVSLGVLGLGFGRNGVLLLRGSVLDAIIERFIVRARAGRLPQVSPPSPDIDFTRKSIDTALKSFVLGRSHRSDLRLSTRRIDVVEFIRELRQSSLERAVLGVLTVLGVARFEIIDFRG